MNYLYNIVQTVEGTLVSTQPTDILAWAEVNDCEVYGFNSNPRNRAELQGQPKITGLCGPMYDGERNGVPVIRYEDQEAYNRLSI
jgi:hypothetical protein